MEVAASTSKGSDAYWINREGVYFPEKKDSKTDSQGDASKAETNHEEL